MANAIADPFDEVPGALALSPLAHKAKARVSDEGREGDPALVGRRPRG